MDYVALKNEILNDPLTLGYNGKTNQEIADLLNAVPAQASTGRQLEREIVDTYEILEATAPAEWASLSATEKQRYQTIISASRVSIKGANVRSAFLAMFAQGTATRTALGALQNRPAARSEVLGFGHVESWDVARARAL